MKKMHWVLLGIGGIIMWAGMILCCLLIIQLGSNYQIGEELLDASEEAYHFNLQTILSTSNESEIFVLIPFPDNFLESANIQVSWKQEEYFRVMDLFMQTVLHEQLRDWRLNAVTSGVNCAVASGQMFPQGMSIEIFREIKSPEQQMRQDLHIIIAPDEEMIRVYRREYYPYEILDYIEWSDFKISIEQALTIADQQGGARVRAMLNNNCEIGARLVAGIEKSDWQISYDPFNEPSVFEIAVDEKTGKYRILREFEK